jgi:putative glutamine amidotransferase
MGGQRAMKICIPVSTSKTQFYVNQAYIEYLRQAGFEPVMITHLNPVEPYVDMCAGLMLPGGIDIDPIHYNESNVASFKTDPEKDDFERRLLHTFLAFQKPVFGICRGFQLIMREWLSEPENKAVAHSLQYYQHISGHNQVDRLDADRTIPTHDVTFIGDRLYGDGAGAGNFRMFVNSMHHQAIVAFPPNKNPNATVFGECHVAAMTRYEWDVKKKGYIVEGVRMSWRGSRVLAVQWHPEELKDLALIQNFFNEMPAQQNLGA